MKNWDQYFIEMADHVATKSKDRSTKVGAVIVGKPNIVLSTGFNGFPMGVDDDNEWRHDRPQKYLYTEHAERNAIFFAARHGISLAGGTMYMNGGGLPCADCTRAIIQAGIVEVVVRDKPFEGKGKLWAEHDKAASEMFAEAGIKITKLTPDFKRV